MRSFETMNTYTEPSTSSVKHAVAGRSSRLLEPRSLCCWQGQRRLKHHTTSARRGIRLDRRPFYCRAEERNSTEEKPAPNASQDDKIKQTLAGLDALLGLEAQEKIDKTQAEKKEAAPEKDGSKGPDLEFSKDVISSISKTEAERLLPGGSEAERKEKEQEITRQMNKIMENARKMADSTRNAEGSRGIDQEMASLSRVLSPETGMPKQHQTRLKEKVFGPTSFFVTSIQPLSYLRMMNVKIVDLNTPSASSPDLISSSVLVRGNLRAPRAEVFDLVCNNLQKEFGDAYTAIMVTDPEAEDEDPRGGPRVAFQIASSSIIQPAKTSNWQWGLAFVLGVLTIATAFQLGLVANVSMLPKEVIDFVQQPDNLKGAVPIEVEDYDPVPYFLSALPITLAVLGTQSAHEVAHRVIASTKKLKLGAPIFLPNAQLGSFGAITQLKSMARNRTDLFDVAAAGPVAAAVISAGLFAAGLSFSQGSSTNGLLPVPAGLLDGSLVLGSITHLVLGEAANSGSVSVHPFLIAGWCGLVTTALNCLPVGCLDGGRIMMAAFGRNLLGVTSFLTYVGLGLGFLGSGLALPFGIFVLLCQRDPEKNLQDTVSQPDNARQTAAAIIVTAAVLILLPMLPGSTSLGANNGFNL